MFEDNTRLVMSIPEQPVPIYVESIGFNPEQETVIRPEGYACYHWLQTFSGEGEIEIDGEVFTLPEYHGCLLMPNVPHKYKRIGEYWKTCYVTFEGPYAAQLLASFGFRMSDLYHWTPDSPMQTLIADMLHTAMRRYDITGLDHSADLYRFLVSLRKHGITDRAPSIQSLIERLNPLLRQLDASYADPELGMSEMADAVGMSARRLNSLFKQAFGYTPYQYLISLRIRKAKEMLLNDRRLAVRAIGNLCGFRDASHFISTFRKLEGVTPEQYRSGYSL